MKYEFDRYLDTPYILLQMANTQLAVTNGEAVCETEAQKKLAILYGGIPAVTQKKKAKKDKS